MTSAQAELLARIETFNIDEGQVGLPFAARLAVALFGTTVLAGSSLAFLQPWYPRQVSAASSSGCGTSGCGTGGCGDGAGGGGGDGGGCGGGGD